MKKSNLLVIASMVLTLLTLGMYNVALKAEYKKGTYKDPFKNFKPLNLKDFTAIDVHAARNMQVKIKPGKFQVWVKDQNAEFAKIKKVGNRLQLDMEYPGSDQGAVQIIITCPQISEITTDNFILVNGKKTTSTSVYTKSLVSVENFTLNQLKLISNGNSGFNLHNNKINQLHASIAILPKENGELHLGPANEIKEATLVIQHQGKLVVKTDKIAKLNATIGDSTEISFTGAALSLLKK